MAFWVVSLAECSKLVHPTLHPLVLRATLLVRADHDYVGPSVGPLVHPSVGPHITSKTDYVAIASRRGEERGNQLMSKTGYVEIASRLVTVARSCL
jgi:hypothetical protein